MKRIVALVLIVLLLTGCGAPAQEQPQPTIEVQQQEISTETAQQETEAGPDYSTLVVESEVLLEEQGQTQQIFSGDVDPQTITWVSADMEIATVADGVVTAVSRGETDITVSFAQQSVICHVVCNLPVPLKLNEGAGVNDPVYLPPDVEIVDEDFFEGSLFIGDSQGLIFYNCVKYLGVLENAKHLARNSYSINSAANNLMLLNWRGIDYVIEEAIAASEAKRVFFMLGINDVGHYKVSDVHLIMENWQNVIDRIQDRTPDVQICIQSLLPVWTNGQTKAVNNEVVNEYNKQLKVLAEENGCVYIDVATYMLDSTGGMATCYCGDQYVHVNVDGVETWVKVLKAYTGY